MIALTVCNDDLFPTKLLQAGAHGYLTKNTNKDEIKTAIQSVVQNKRYISPEIASKIALRHLSDEGGVPFDSLSERELQVTMMITKGHKVQQISDVLFLSPIALFIVELVFPKSNCFMFYLSRSRLFSAPRFELMIMQFRQCLRLQKNY